jgi:hypothetical protein
MERRFSEDVQFDLETLDECEKWMANYSTIGDKVTRSEFTENLLLKLIRYEVLTRRRTKYIKRMFSRYYKLRRERQWRELVQIMGELGNAGKGSRKLL